MMLTTTQASALKAAILADPVMGPALTAGQDSLVANWLNELASPEYIVWRSSVTQDEIMLNGFDWTRVDNLSVGPARVWEWLFGNEARTINPSKPNVRAGIDAVWKGTAADLAVRAAVYVHCKRPATRAERITATGPGTTADPATMDFEGQISPAEVSWLRD